MVDFKPGYFRERPVSELPPELPEVRGMLEGYYGFNDAESRAFDKFISDTATIESEGGTVNPDSSARGIYQFMTTKGKGQNAFQTALKRTERTYKNFGSDVPDWVTRAKKHGDPESLTESQQRDVFLSNIWKQKGTDKLIRKVVGGDPESAVNLYMDHHHTRSGPKDAVRRSEERARKFYGARYGDGGLIRDAYGRTLI